MSIPNQPAMRRIRLAKIQTRKTSRSSVKSLNKNGTKTANGLGPERHREMEQLWLEGRRPRGDPQAIARLEKLLVDFPDTNRAGCAAYELGHHYLRNRQLNEQERRSQAEYYWRMIDERYRDTLCEYNAPADAMAKYSLVNWIYRSTDQALARRLLKRVDNPTPG